MYGGNSMKVTAKLLITVLVLMSAFFMLGGCGSGSESESSPSDTVDAFLQAVKAQDEEAMAKVYSGGSFDLLDATSAAGEEEATIEGEESTEIGMTDAIDESMRPLLQDFDYEITNEQIDGDTATVDAEVTTYPVGEAFSAYFSEYLEKSLDMVMEDASTEEMDQLAFDILSEKLSGLTEKTYKGAVTLTLTKSDGKWMVDKIEKGSETADVLTGGLVTAINNMDDAFSVWDE